MKQVKQLIKAALEILAAQPASDNEYFEAVSTHYGPELVRFIKSGEHLAKSITGGKIETEKSDNGNLIVRWSEGKKESVILGLVSVTGKLNRKDLPDFNNWINRIVEKLKKGHTLLTSPNQLSKPLLEKILNRVKREGLEIDQSSFGKFEFDGVTWENIAITTQKVKE